MQDPAIEPLTVTRSEERLQVGTQRVVHGRLMLRKRIVTERLTVEVDVRREELVVEQENVAPGQAGASVGPSPHLREPLVVVLREEVPDVRVRIQPYEQVRVHVSETATRHQVTEVLRKEVVDVEAVDRAAGQAGGVRPEAVGGLDR